MTDQEVLEKISALLHVDYEVKPKIWEYGFCGKCPVFEVAFEGNCVVQLGCTKMTVQALELCAAFRSLEILNICYAEVDRFPEALCQLPKLKLLNLYGTKITELPDSIGKLSALEELQFGGTKIEYLPDTVCNLSRLRELCAQHSGLKRLPMSIGKLTNLETLDIHHSDVDELPESLADCKNLRRLWWQFNEDDPQIPEAVTANITANFGTTSEMTAFAHFRIHCRNKQFVTQVVTADYMLLQIWNDYDALLEVDCKAVIYFVGSYVDVDSAGERHMITESVASSDICPLDDDEELVPAMLGTDILHAKYSRKSREIPKAEMEGWIPRMYGFYGLDQNFDRSYPDFLRCMQEKIDKVFK